MENELNGQNPPTRGNTEEKPDRLPNGTFAKGREKTGGREKGVRNLTTKVREALEKIADGKDYTYEEALIKAILKKAIVDQDVAIIRLIWNYLDGMPLQKTDITSNGDKITPIYAGLSIQGHPGDQKDIQLNEKD